MKKNVLIDVRIVVEPPPWVYWGNIEYAAKELTDWVNEFNDFIRDHRSQDRVTLDLERVYEERCEFCGYDWEEDDTGRPLCCQKAIDEYEAQQAREELEADIQQ